MARQRRITFKVELPKRRNPHALDAKMRRAPTFKDRKKEASRKACRGGGHDRRSAE